MMFNFTPVYIVALQFLYVLNNALELKPRRINPYETIFKKLLREPPIDVDNITNKDYSEINEQWLEQPIDHFDKNNTETWTCCGGPIFVFVGGEWEILPHMLKVGHFYDMAKQQEALMFYTEHRYYGKSLPKSRNSYNNLQFLNVLQSLEDLKHFITYQKSTSKALKNAKVVLVGGSYSASMVAWFMKLYPQNADVAWASSAPLKAKMDFSEYMTLAMTSIQQRGDDGCSQKLGKAFQGLAKEMQSHKPHSILKRLKMCQTFDITNPLDRQAFFNGLGNYFAGLVQSFSSSIPQFCKSFVSLDVEPTEALIKFFKELYLSTGEFKIREEADEWCFDFSYQGMRSIFISENALKAGTRPWFYQTCHEFGWFATTSNATLTTASTLHASTLPFGGQVPLSYFQQLCQDVFGNCKHSSAKNMGHCKESPQVTLQQLHARALATNKLFGGFSHISNRVIFTHGLLDPWRAAGLQHGHNVLLIKDYSHVEDMGSINYGDSVEMNVAKLKVASFINNILRHH